MATPNREPQDCSRNIGMRTPASMFLALSCYILGGRSHFWCPFKIRSLDENPPPPPLCTNQQPQYNNNDNTLSGRGTCIIGGWFSGVGFFGGEGITATLNLKPNLTSGHLSKRRSLRHYQFLRSGSRLWALGTGLSITAP